MAKVRYDEYIKSIFEPIVALAKIGDIKKLKTAGLNPEIQSEQFERFDSLEVYSDEVITLRNGDFIAKLKCKDEYYIVISTEFFPSCDTDKLFDCIDNLNAQEHHIEECFFIKLCYHLQGFYKPSLENSQDRELEEKLALGHREEKESYQGHEIDELIDVYRPIKVFKLDSNSVIPELGIWYLAAKLALYCPCLRSENINSDILSTANNIIELNSANYENIYLSLTSLHWKHIYLEVYRCIEGLYYLPWMLTLRDQIGTNKNAFELAKIVQESIKWREKEKESIKISSLY
ncbi:hypothetical protein [Veronia pacifica]|uniref:Uncharacterized protein n=1 Tax=Veronia pacifica TaxID=1080227 RepID=A0A1C3EQ41_9GAMM|nr:hypothetical protein [Veronia pacifica]ODA35361.1 hypothetical protein A8L45_04135 [Veronia pacifica]